MDKLKLLLSLVAILLGGIVILYGGMDDSPGAQLIGLMGAIIGVVGILKSWKR